MSNLYRVTIEREIYVIADSDFDAEDIALRNEHHETVDTFYAQQVSSLTSVPAEWRTSLPYGGDHDLTCEQFLQAAQEQANEI